LCFIFLLASVHSLCAQQYLVKDINTHEFLEGEFRNLTDVNGTLYFTVFDELWKSDGTEAGTVLVKKLSSIGNLTNLAGTVFFTAYDPESGNELWKSDGTGPGTLKVKDIRPGTAGSDAANLTAVDNKLYFVAHDGATGRELWKSDGTPSGTQRVKDIVRVTGSSNPSNLVAMNGTLYFVANDAVNGYELWSSDGTAAGTNMVKDIRPEYKVGSAPNLVTAMNNMLYFIASDVNSEKHLWRSDGTAAGTVKVKDVWIKADASGIGKLTHANGLLYFMGYDAQHGNEPWVSDGTPGGTHLIKDITPGPGSNSLYATSHLSDFTGIGGLVYFLAVEKQQRRLWRTDGTEAGTFPVTDDDHAWFVFQEPSITGLNGEAFFIASGGDAGMSNLWKSNGTPETTQIFKASTGYGYQGDAFPTVSGGFLYFVAADIPDGSYKLWKTNGTAGSITPVKDVFKYTESSHPHLLTNVGQHIFFQAYDGTSNGLWKTDGTEAGTVLLKYLAGVENMTDVNGALYFSSQQQLWKSDGTSEGTQQVPGTPADFIPDNFTNVNGTLYFSSFGAIWKSDGTQAGTVVVKGLGYCELLRNVNGTLFFAADDHVHGRELWKSDGTEAGTVLVKDIYPGGTYSKITDPVAVNGILYFFADDGTHGNELWRSNGTDGGTFMVKDIRTGDPGVDSEFTVDIRHLTVVNNTLYFAGLDASSNWALWKSDGTEAGTVLVKNTEPITSAMVAGVNEVYFIQPNSEARSELWRSDGTEAGTYLIKNLDVWASYSFYKSIVHDEILYLLTAFGGVWRTDGTECGTFKVVDANFGSYELNILDNTLYFADFELGPDTEIFGFPIDDIPPSPCPTELARQGGSQAREATPGIDGSEPSIKVSHYPNPFTTEIAINVSGEDGTRYQAMITNLSGVRIEGYENLKCNTDYVMGEAWPGGVYVLEVLVKGRRTTYKIVKLD
jgi:ELWxxDGT repeat protein